MPIQSPSPLDRAFQALADPTRRAIVQRLTQSPASVSELARPFAMAMPSVLQHLAMLEEAGLVVSEKVGRVRTCRLAPEGLSAAEMWITARRQEWQQRLDRLGAYLNELKTQGGSDE